MNQYQEMRDRQQQEFNALPLGFAFGQKQFNEMMRGWGLHPERDVKKICAIGAGGYIQKKDVELLRQTSARHKEELAAAIEADTTGDGFIFQMFYRELKNHEYGYTGDADDTAGHTETTRWNRYSRDQRLVQRFQQACKKIMEEES